MFRESLLLAVIVIREREGVTAPGAPQNAWGPHTALQWAVRRRSCGHTGEAVASGWGWEALAVTWRVGASDFPGTQISRAAGPALEPQPCGIRSAAGALATEFP